MTKRIIKVLAIVLCGIILIGCIVVLVWFGNAKKDFVKFDVAKLSNVCSSVKILDDNGQEIKGAVNFGSSKQIPISALHDYTYMAFVAVEDKRFFEHDGIDYKRIVGATLHNLKSRSFKEGASTISQQLIKNTHLNNNKNLHRKVNEMLLARELERKYSKMEILEMYLNTIYFGRKAYGLETASNVYFNKSASELTVAESATLAGMIKAPNTYSPDKNVEKCKKRRNAVLRLMLEQNVIDNEQFDIATNSNIDYEPYVSAKVNSYVQQTLDEACSLLNMTKQQLACSDFVIETYFNADIQKSLQDVASKDETQNTDKSLADLSCVICNNKGGIVACYFRGSGLSKKQIGSAAKPIAVYTPALCEKLITQASPVLDEPTDFGGYKPTNASGYCGWTTVKTAVAKSLNVPAVKTLNTLGLKTAQKYLEKMGFSGEQNLSLALGNINGGMNIFELANCYGTLRDGKENGCTFIKSISSANGEIYSRKERNNKVFDETSCYLMTDMLQYAVKCGTAKILNQTKLDVAAKTGTVGTPNGNSEALVAGYTTEHTFVFWYSGNMPNSVNGATAPCQLASSVLQEIYKTKPKKFDKPNGITELEVDSEMLKSNQLVVLGNGEKFLFDKTNVPKEIVCNYNYQLTTEMSNGKMLLQLPDVPNMTWKMFCLKDGKKQEISTCQVESGTYFAELWRGNMCVYTTPQLQVHVPEDTTNFWEFWYLPFNNK